jgi:hypothetical protein
MYLDQNSKININSWFALLINTVLNNHLQDFLVILTRLLYVRMINNQVFFQCSFEIILQYYYNYNY